MKDNTDNYSKLQKAADLILEVYNDRKDYVGGIDMSTPTFQLSVAHGKVLASIQMLRLEEKMKKQRAELREDVEL